MNYKMPVHKFTAKDDKGYLRSYVEFNCIECGELTVQRKEEFDRKGELCRNCKIKVYRKKKAEQKTEKELEKICAKCLKGKLKTRYMKRNLTCNIQLNNLLILFKKNCHYCGSEPSNIYHYKNKYNKYDFLYNGLDRIDSNKGYTIDNVVSCCKKCNIAKSSMEYDEFINYIKEVYEHLCHQ